MSKKKELVYPELPAGYRLVDTHCHLDMNAYQSDLEPVLHQAATRGVGRIITVGIDPASSARAVALAEKYPGVSATVGIHPHNLGECTEESLAGLAELARHPKVVAFGEIGMDLHYDYFPADLQRRHFARQVALAQEMALPLVIHDRDAHAQVLAVLREGGPFPAGGVMHCFSGDAALAEAVMELGFYISITGVVTFAKSAQLQEAICQTPLDRLLLETDGPYLAPEPRRGRRNEPALLLFTAARVAELKGVTLAELATTTTANAEKLFRLSSEILNGSVSEVDA
ncbi:MAG: TatD family hydrolase [Desulfobulbaceae bacterium]|nr:TatD family hydrolase [Desulfobulbaceae bacterium]